MLTKYLFLALVILQRFRNKANHYALEREDTSENTKSTPHLSLLHPTHMKCIKKVILIAIFTLFKLFRFIDKFTGKFFRRHT